MTVQELISELQECDRPDAEVICLTSQIHDTPFSVWYDEADGPVYIDSQAYAKARAEAK